MTCGLRPRYRSAGHTRGDASGATRFRLKPYVLHWVAVVVARWITWALAGRAVPRAGATNHASAAAPPPTAPLDHLATRACSGGHEGRVTALTHHKRSAAARAHRAAHKHTRRRWHMQRAFTHPTTPWQASLAPSCLNLVERLRLVRVACVRSTHVRSTSRTCCMPGRTSRVCSSSLTSVS